MLEVRGNHRLLKVAKSPMTPSKVYKNCITTAGPINEQNDDESQLETSNRSVVAVSIGTRDIFAAGERATEQPE